MVGSNDRDVLLAEQSPRRCRKWRRGLLFVEACLCSPRGPDSRSTASRHPRARCMRSAASASLTAKRMSIDAKSLQKNISQCPRYAPVRFSQSAAASWPLAGLSSQHPNTSATRSQPSSVLRPVRRQRARHQRLSRPPAVQFPHLFLGDFSRRSWSPGGHVSSAVQHDHSDRRFAGTPALLSGACG